jgi:hypothetical protein
MKKIGIFFILLVLFVTSVIASGEILIFHESIKEKSLPDEEFIFSVTIENTRNVTDVLRFYAPGTYWEWVFRVEPIVIKIDPESSKTVDLYLAAYGDKAPGNYAVTLELVSNNYSEISEEYSFNVEILDYEKVIDIELELPSTLKSDQDNLFRIGLKKDYDYDIPNISIQLQSDYFDKFIEVGTLGTSDVEREVLINLGEKVNVGENDIKILVFRGDKLIIEKVEKFNVAASGDVQEIGTPENGFLFFKDTIERVNNKNAVSYETLTKRLTYFQKLFTDFSEEPNSVVKENGEYVYTWEFGLDPGESKVIYIETDYRKFVYGAIVAIAIIWLLYIYFKKDLLIMKRITSIQHSQDNVSTLNILLILKNKSLRKVKNVKLMDGMANVVEKPSEFGSISPTRIMRSVSGTKMLWEIPMMEPGAEIAISYTVKCKAKIIGKLNIPVALVKYMKSGRKIVVKSNKIKIFG